MTVLSMRTSLVSPKLSTLLIPKLLTSPLRQGRIGPGREMLVPTSSPRLLHSPRILVL